MGPKKKVQGKIMEAVSRLKLGGQTAAAGATTLANLATDNATCKRIKDSGVIPDLVSLLDASETREKAAYALSALMVKESGSAVRKTETYPLHDT